MSEMTGLERLRALGREQEERSWSTVGKVRGRLMLQIAEQIEDERFREQLAVERVASEMELHCLGVEGMDDSPVARWARELRGAMGATMSRHESDAVAGSPYDALPPEDREAVAWVREHGGLDAMVELSSRLMTVDALRAAIEETCTRIGVERTGDLTQDAQAIWREIGALRSRLKESVPRAAYERHLARRQRQIDESHAALRRRNARIGFLVSELNRANHENREEFMRRAGDYTAFTDEVCKLLASELRYVEGCSKDVMDAALDALDRRLMPEGMEWPRYESGELVEVGDEVSVTVHDEDGDFERSMAAESVSFDGHGVIIGDSRHVVRLLSGERVRRPAVLAADGEPLEAGQTVYGIGRSQHEFEVLAPNDVNPEVGDRFNVKCFDKDENEECWCDPRLLTHTKPEPRDSWERIEEDARGLDSGVDCELFTHTHEDIVRRCKALAGVTE